MIGRQVTETNTYLSLETLLNLMAERWNKTEYNDFCIGKPTPALH